MFPNPSQKINTGQNPPIGEGRWHQNIGAYYDDNVGRWLRSGVSILAGEYPEAIKLPQLQLFGVPPNVGPTGNNTVYDVATDGAGNYVICFNSTTNVYVSQDGGRNWTTLAHGLGLNCNSAAWDSQNGYWIFAGNDATNLKIATTPDLGTAGTLRDTYAPSTPTANTTVVRCTKTGGNAVVVCQASSIAIRYSTTAVTWAGGTALGIGFPPRLTTDSSGTWWLAQNGSATNYASFGTFGATWAAQTAFPAAVIGIAYSSVLGYVGWTSGGVLYATTTFPASYSTLPNYALIAGDRPAGGNASAYVTPDNRGLMWLTADFTGIYEYRSVPEVMGYTTPYMPRWRRFSVDFTGGTGAALAFGQSDFVIALNLNSNIQVLYGELADPRYIGIQKPLYPQDTLTANCPMLYTRIR